MATFAEYKENASFDAENLSVVESWSLVDFVAANGKPLGTDKFTSQFDGSTNNVILWNVNGSRVNVSYGRSIEPKNQSLSWIGKNKDSLNVILDGNGRYKVCQGHQYKKATKQELDLF